MLVSASMETWKLTFLTLALVLTVPVRAHADIVTEWARPAANLPAVFFAGEEVRARRLPAAKRRAALLQLATRYERAYRIQEAIWTLSELGENERAESLKKKLREYLLRAPVVKSVRDLPSGAYRPPHVYFANGISAVRKPFHPGKRPDPQMEVVAYQLDLLLGLDIVPMTVLRKEGEHQGSLQYFIRDAAMGKIGRQCAPGKFQHGNARIGLLDYLLDHRDSHGHNWLKRPGGHPVAVDHANCEPNGQQLELQAPWWIRRNLRERFLPRLKALSREMLRKRIGGLVAENRILAILARRDHVVSWLKDAPTDNDVLEMLDSANWGTDVSLKKLASRLVIEMLSDEKTRTRLFETIGHRNRFAFFVQHHLGLFSPPVLQGYLQLIKTKPNPNPMYKEAVKACARHLEKAGNRAPNKAESTGANDAASEARR